MNNKYLAILSSVLIVITSCKGKSEKKNTAIEVATEKPIGEKGVSKAEKIINEAISAHGGELYHTAHYGFTFRKKTYTFNNNNGYSYTMTDVDDMGRSIKDELKNGTFTRTMDDKEVSLSQKETSKHSQALNSVVYFAMLPYKLQDKAVFKTYIGETTIKALGYDVVKVTFSEENGGKDFDDEFYYWVNKNTKAIDYLAYDYQVNEGGVRYRSAYNRRNIDGVVFQDYINWEAPIGTPLKELPLLYAQGKLKELSRIVTENVHSLK